MFKQYSLNRLLILLTSIGFAFLLIDTSIEHWSMFTQEVMVFVPLVFSLICFIVAVITVIIWKEKLIRLMQIFLFASFIVAGAGLYFHLELWEDETKLTAEEVEHEVKEKEKPLLAPLSFAGIAVVGLLGTMRKWEAEIKN